MGKVKDIGQEVVVEILLLPIEIAKNTPKS
jgi:hypothetical protein